MKRIHFLILISIVLCAVFALALVGCNSNALPRPDGLKLDGPTLTLSWRANENALYYVVNISGNGINQDRNTRKNSFSLSNIALDEGDYQIRVKSLGDGKNYKDSAWSDPITFSQDADSGLTFRFIKNNSEVEVTGMGRATGDVVIPDTYRGLPVTSIGERAFAQKSKLTGIVMSDNVTSIGASAFYNSTFITTVKLSKNLVSIGDRAFQSCRLLEGVLEIPENLTQIGVSAFAYCSSLTGIDFNDKLVSIGNQAFESCTALERLELPDSLQTVGDNAFYNCESIASIKFGRGLESVGEYAFAMCNSLESISFNQGFKTIGPYAFGRCEKLTTVEFSSTVETVGEGAFFEDKALVNIELNDGLKRIAVGAFRDTAHWTNSENDVYLDGWFLGCKDNTVSTVKIVDGTIGIANYALAGYENVLEIVLPNSVKIIGDGAFSTSKMLSVIIGSGVEEIGKQAFYKCESLVSVVLGAFDDVTEKMTDSSLKIINEYAFMGCTQLANIEIPSTTEVISSYAFNDSALYNNSNGVVYAGNWVVGCDNTSVRSTVAIIDGTVGIANYAFYKCTNVSVVYMPDSIKTIGRSAFYQCSNLTSVTLPSELEVIEDYTFYSCTNLMLPVLPQTLKSIGRSAFYKCALSNDNRADTDSDVLAIPDSVELIGDYAFYGCGYTSYDFENGVVNKCGIDEVVIGNNVKSIGNNAFSSIASLKRIVLGDKLQSIGDRAFYQCEALEFVNFNDNLQHIGARAFYGCNNLSEIALPDGLTSIDKYAFYRCMGLTSVSFGANIQSIGEYAFYGCNALTELVLPDSVNSIGKQAFRACTGLKSVVLGGNIEFIDAHAFYGCSSLTIYAQDTSAPEGWNERFNSAYRPIIWGCTIKDGYVYSVTKNANTISNLNETNELSAPFREGFVFLGWSTVEGASEAQYTMDGLADVGNGTRLYAVWIENDNIEIQE